MLATPNRPVNHERDSSVIAFSHSKGVKGAVEGGLRANETQAPSDLNGASPWLSSQQVASIWGVHVNSVRSWSDSGKLPVHRLEKGCHRRFLRSEIEGVLGCPRSEKETKGGDSRPAAIYARTSTSKQAKGYHKGESDSDLARQVEKLKVWAKERNHGVEPRVYSDVGSGLSWRKGLEQLLKAVIRGEVGVIYCTFKDRLARFDVAVQLFQAVCKEKGVDLVFIEKEEEQGEDEQKELVEDLLAIITHFSAKVHGKRAAATLKAPLSGETIQAALKLKSQGFNANQAAKLLAQEGHRNGKGRPVSLWNVQTLYDTCGDTLNGLVEGEEGSSFEEWASANLEKQEGARGRVNTIHEAYAAWAIANNKIPLSNISVQRYLRDHFGFTTYKSNRVYHCRLKADL